jgi:hypothetical protein
MTFLLGEGLWPETPGPLPLTLGFADSPPDELLLASTRGCEVAGAFLGCSSSALRTTGDSLEVSMVENKQECYLHPMHACSQVSEYI